MFRVLQRRRAASLPVNGIICPRCTIGLNLMIWKSCYVWNTPQTSVVRQILWAWVLPKRSRGTKLLVSLSDEPGRSIWVCELDRIWTLWTSNQANYSHGKMLEQSTWHCWACTVRNIISAVEKVYKAFYDNCSNNGLLVQILLLLHLLVSFKNILADTYLILRK